MNNEGRKIEILSGPLHRFFGTNIFTNVDVNHKTKTNNMQYDCVKSNLPQI